MSARVSPSTACAAVGVGIALVCACSLTIDSSNLTGGERPDSGHGADGDGGPCDPFACLGVDALVVKLADIAPCTRDTPAAERMNCRKRIHDLCVARDSCCFQGGFGPIEFPNSLEATIVCLPGEPYTSPASEVTVSGCALASLGSRTCDQTTHAAAKKRGHETGILQGVSGDTISVLGTNGVSPAPDVPWAELTKLVPACTAATVDSQDCTTAAHRYCSGDAIAAITGWGPVVWTPTTLTLMCLL